MTLIVRSALLCFLLALTALSSIGQTADVYPLRKVLLADSEEKVAALPDEAGGSVVVFAQDLPIFNEPEFQRLIGQIAGKPISLDLLKGIMEAVSAYAVKHDVVATAVPLGSQNISGGVLRFSVKFGRYQDITFQGNRWFSRKLLEEAGVSWRGR